jgi:hypothetical protein
LVRLRRQPGFQFAGEAGVEVGAGGVGLNGHF